MSHNFCLTLPNSGFMSHISCLMSHVSCILLCISCLMSHIYCLTSPVSCLLSYVSRLTYPASCLLSYVSSIYCLYKRQQYYTILLSVSFPLLKLRKIVLYILSYCPKSAIKMDFIQKLAQKWRDLEPPYILRHCHLTIFLLSRYRDIIHLF